MSAPAEPDPTVGDGPPTRPGPVIADATTRSLPPLPESFADGRYRVIRRIGVGGMGLVMCARDEVLGRDVAVKMLADNLSADASSRARFLYEARAAASVTDPRVVGVFDVGEESGRPYLVMEYVDGPSLAEVLATDGPLPADEVLRVAVDALAGLGAAHDAGLLHRDVKPGNLLRAPDGTTMVTDFGVAIAVGDDRLTRTGFVIGTAAYLAPERRRGEAATVRTDLWALGATLTELLTGQPPGDLADALLSRLGADVPPELRRLLPRLLAPAPADRPQDALEALELLAGDAVSSHAPTPAPLGRETRVLPIRAHSRPRAGASATPVEGALPPGSTTPSDTPSPGGDRPRRWPQLLVLVTLIVGGVLALGALVDRGDEPTTHEPTFAPVVIDPDDPPGTAEELAERLRQHAGG
jgi:serine/threonine protein kinase